MAYTTINKSTDYFNTKLYTGNGGTQAVTGVGFQPDWVWLKSRSDAYSHQLFDAVRGTTKLLTSEATDAEQTISGVTAFGTDGFTVGSDAGSNGNTKTYVSWNWKAGTGQGSSNTDGSINTTYTSVNTTAGFSICKWTGTGSAGTIGHGLGAVPKMIIIKDLSNTRDWFVYHASIGNNKRLKLNDNVAEGASTVFNNTTPTSSVFSIDGSVYVNNSGSNYIAYCFSEVTGYSKFGSYTGNGNADGTFVYTGFKPAFVLTKYATSTSGWWQILDNKRDVYNPNSHALFTNVSDSEYNLSNYHTDYLSNGFKLRNTQAGGNTSGGTYIYMAFGQSLVGSNNVPCTAR